MKTIRELQLGKSLLRLVQTSTDFAGVMVRDGKTSATTRGADPDDVWRELLASTDKAGAAYVGYDGARGRFLTLFPGGFTSAAYREHERDYKLRAQALLGERLPLERARAASAEDCLGAMAVFAKTNMLSVFEHARVREILKGKDGPAFVQGAAALTDGDLSGGLQAMMRASKSYGPPSWPMFTYLPFFWDSDGQMFLKPQVTRDFAERVGHRFARDYERGFEATVYESLLDLASQTDREINQLGPLDRIDIQSFIWIVGAYTDADASVD